MSGGGGPVGVKVRAYVDADTRPATRTALPPPPPAEPSGSRRNARTSRSVVTALLSDAGGVPVVGSGSSSLTTASMPDGGAYGGTSYPVGTPAPTWPDGARASAGELAAPDAAGAGDELPPDVPSANPPPPPPPYGEPPPPLPPAAAGAAAGPGDAYADDDDVAMEVKPYPLDPPPAPLPPPAGGRARGEEDEAGTGDAPPPLPPPLPTLTGAATGCEPINGPPRRPDMVDLR
jgi:hypothetical protein